MRSAYNLCEDTHLAGVKQDRQIEMRLVKHSADERHHKHRYSIIDLQLQVEDLQGQVQAVPLSATKARQR